MTFTIFLALDNNNHILARCHTLAEAYAVDGCIRTRVEYVEEPHRMYIDNDRQADFETSLHEQAEKFRNHLYEDKAEAQRELLAAIAAQA